MDVAEQEPVLQLEVERLQCIFVSTWHTPVRAIVVRLDLQLARGRNLPAPARQYVLRA
jgi:hypothetical protein